VAVQKMASYKEIMIVINLQHHTLTELAYPYIQCSTVQYIADNMHA